MITPKIDQTSASVGRHYDELDEFYRDVWGNHVHHGYWQTGRETSAEAAEALSELVATLLMLEAGMRIADIGCGYGETARLFASRYGVRVDGVTISKAQFERASAFPAEGVCMTLGDWLANTFPDAAFDRAYAIESSEHMPDKQKFFSEAYRVLKPGGRFAVCAWLAKTDARPWQQSYLLEPICRQGRLPGMGTEEDYRDLSGHAGFSTVEVHDISAQVWRTWAICIGRVARKAVTRPRYLQFLFASEARNRIFAVTLPLILAAYRTGAMRYCVFLFEKPASGHR